MRITNGERLVYNTLKNTYQAQFIKLQYRDIKCPMLPYDCCFVYDLRRYLLEYDGMQHFQIGKFSRTQKKLSSLQMRDRVKTRFALENGYRIVRIDYSVITESKLMEHLNRVFNSNSDYYFSDNCKYSYITSMNIPLDIYKKYVS